MTTPPSLSPFGVFHFDDLEKVERELEDFVDDPDAVFVEHPPRDVSSYTFLELLLRAPLFALGVLLVGILVQGLPMLVLHRDLRPTEVIAAEWLHERRDLPVHALDDELGPWFTRVGLPTTLANWAVVLGLAWLSPVGVSVTVALLLAALVPFWLRARAYRTLAILAACGWYLALAGLLVARLFTSSALSVSLLVVAGVVILVLLPRSIDDRNERMLDNGADLVAEESYDHAILFTGAAHLSGVVRDASDHGFTVPRVHVSEFRSEGETHEPVDPEALPSHASGRRSGRVIASESECGDVRPRLVSAAADALVLFAVGLLCTLVSMLAYATHADSTFSYLELGAVVFVGFVAVPLGLKTYQEWRSATTAGKRPRDLAVADAADGTAPSLRAAFLRNLLWPVDALGIGLVAVLATERNQRLGDLVAGTVVGRDVAARANAEPEVAESPDGAVADDLPG